MENHEFTDNMFTSFKHKLKFFIVDDLTKRKIFSFLTDKQVVLLDYFFTFGRIPNLVNPRRITEKIQWIKLFGNLERYSFYQDKYEVRRFVRKTVGAKYLVPLLGVWDKFEQIDFDKLPKRFVLKANHGANYNFICKDKSHIDKEKLKKTVNFWMNDNLYKMTRESQYKNINPKIICEKYIKDDSGKLTDYKFIYSNGKLQMIDVHLDRFTNHRTLMMSPTWRRLPMSVSFEPKGEEKTTPPKPANLKEMISVSKKLARQFPFVRVDMYSVNSKTYFGELTITPANGLMQYDPPSVDLRLGNLLDISKYK